MFHALELRLREELPADCPAEVTTVVAVSGGADSVALLRAMAAVAKSGDAKRLVVAHFDHGLRPDSSEDAVFVRRTLPSTQHRVQHRSCA